MIRPKGLGIFSGGLDSMLAAEHLRRIGVDVRLVTFETPFFSADKARQSAAVLGLPLLVEEVGEEHFELVKNPPSGYGGHMNPCIDCHAFMFRKAGEIMLREGCDFLFSGEVLGQRPMSQNKQSLARVAKLSGQTERIVRPLSAQLLPPTKPEEEGLLEREKLLAISGRGRKDQMALAEEYGIREYPAPAGGCSLTEPGYSQRLKDLLTHNPDASLAEVDLLRYGRHLRLSPSAKLILGRNQGENRTLAALDQAGGRRMDAKDRPGPFGLYFGPDHGPDLELAAALLAGYGQAQPGDDVVVEVEGLPDLGVAALHKRHAQGMLL